MIEYAIREAVSIKSSFYKWNADKKNIDAAWKKYAKRIYEERMKGCELPNGTYYPTTARYLQIMYGAMT